MTHATPVQNLTERAERGWGVALVWVDEDVCQQLQHSGKHSLDQRDQNLSRAYGSAHCVQLRVQTTGDPSADQACMRGYAADLRVHAGVLLLRLLALVDGLCRGHVQAIQQLGPQLTPDELGSNEVTNLLHPTGQLLDEPLLDRARILRVCVMCGVTRSQAHQHPTQLERTPLMCNIGQATRHTPHRLIATLPYLQRHR